MSRPGRNPSTSRRPFTARITKFVSSERPCRGDNSVPARDALGPNARGLKVHVEQSEFRNLAVLELDAVHRLACHLRSRSDAVDDLVQETYLRAFSSTKSGDFTLTEHGLRPYLFKILHNVVYSRALKAQHDPSATHALIADAADEVESNGGCSQLSDVDWDQVDDRLKRAIESLPLAHRTVLLLCAVEGLRYREIADVMQVPVGTVMSRLHRARQLLCKQLSSLTAERRLGGNKASDSAGSNAGA